MCCSSIRGKIARPPKWIKPQLTRNADEAPAGDDWLHEVKYDDYRMHARLECNWSARLFSTSTDYGWLLTVGSQQGLGSSRGHPQPGEAGTSERAPSFR